ncbi:hypothetical protein VOLCADRAFT_109910 [Volvox carteri f. nagariensis]|uniref:Lipoyl-binding domain-containing protein n=1 Tax=Volvox carteri f. nagariensis TaxID=3068 RepID=D8U5T3_VOLCA|nr:uncharacterized protein VOLCADRAFT_109910 [Volvox carteri f. nagariensis]EFJ45055.1 hypothetical protein VOLCADRAFT_109910 [Volvox carteri f. nagariensis]|eukprot:XP_002954026.1 hypothetical protein VOLCADRAFT_109910 [Volvox carteri f. nagariensis]
MLTRSSAPQRPAGVAASRSVRAVRTTITTRLPILKAAATEAKKEVDVSVEDEYNGPDIAPSTQQVASFLNTLCNETEIAEMHLKMGNFELKVKRSVAGSAAAAPLYASTVAPATPAEPVVASSPLQSVEAPPPASVEDTVDESLVYVTSPKVGTFRRGKYAGGKRVGKGNCADVNAPVKKGQTLGYVEQLGTFVEVKAPIAGELVKVHLEDGAPVEYQQLIFEVAPFFGGHIIGDSKYA